MNSETRGRTAESLSVLQTVQRLADEDGDELTPKMEAPDERSRITLSLRIRGKRGQVCVVWGGPELPTSLSWRCTSSKFLASCMHLQSRRSFNLDRHGGIACQTNGLKAGTATPEVFSRHDGPRILPSEPKDNTPSFLVVSVRRPLRGADVIGPARFAAGPDSTPIQISRPGRSNNKRFGYVFRALEALAPTSRFDGFDGLRRQALGSEC